MSQYWPYIVQVLLLLGVGECSDLGDCLSIGCDLVLKACAVLSPQSFLHSAELSMHFRDLLSTQSKFEVLHSAMNEGPVPVTCSRVS